MKCRGSEELKMLEDDVEKQMIEDEMNQNSRERKQTYKKGTGRL